MLERCLDSRQLFLMLLLGIFPKGKRGVEWVGALAGRNPQPPLFLPKGGTPRHINFWAKKVMIIHLSGSTLQCIPSVLFFHAALTLLLIIKPPANTARCFVLVTLWASSPFRLFFFLTNYPGNLCG